MTKPTGAANGEGSTPKLGRRHWSPEKKEKKKEESGPAQKGRTGGREDEVGQTEAGG